MNEWIDDALKFVISMTVVVGCFALLIQEKGDPIQPWLLLTIVLAWNRGKR